MASIILYNNTDKSLTLSGSEFIYKAIEVPSGTIDLRFAVPLFVAGTSAQSFNPSVSKYESFRMIFTQNSGSSDTGTFIGVGPKNGEFSAVHQHAGYVKLAIGSSATGGYNGTPDWAQCNLNMTGFHTTGPDSNGLIICQGDAGASPTYGCILILRIYRTSTASSEVFLELRHKYPVNLSNLTDSNFRMYITDLNQSTSVGLVSTGNNPSSYFNDITSVFFSWPFFNIPLTIPIIGYRAITE